jgi:hypothetical protein
MTQTDSESEDFDKQVLLRKQRGVLLSAPESSIVIYRYPELMEAVEKADEINNDLDEDWDSFFFCATFSRQQVNGQYEVLIKVRPGSDRKAVRALYEVADVASHLTPETAVFIQELGGDHLATRSVNGLSRYGIKSMSDLRDLYQELGEERFISRLNNMRQIGAGSIARILEKVKGA